MTSSDALDELAAELGGAAVLRRGADDDLERFLQPWRGPRGDAPAVVRPADTEQVRTTLRWARRHRVRLLPQGANTGLVGASTPPPDGDVVVLSTERLRGEPTIDPVDRTAVVAAGVRLSELNAAAAVHGLELPIDLGADPTLGGMVSTNTGGSRMLAHGDLRRSLLGLRAVLADDGCSVLDELHTLRKHNVGPSLAQLLVGAGGALGVVTEVALELSPLPAERATAWLEPSSTGALPELLVVLERHHATALSAFEVVSRPAMDAALALPSTPAHPMPAATTVAGHLALVELSGPRGTGEGLAPALAHLHDAGLVHDAVVVPAQDAWALRHAVTEGLARRGTVLGADVSVPRSALPALVETVVEELRSVLPRAELADFGHWGDGGVHCNVVVPDPAPSDAERAAVRDMVLGIVVERFGGSFSAEHGIGPVNADWWRRTTPASTRHLLRAVAELVDPLALLGHPGLPYRTG